MTHWPRNNPRPHGQNRPALMDAVCPPPRCSPRSMPTAAGPGLADGGGTGVAKDIEVYAHYGHEGGVDYHVDWQLSWFVECFPDQG